MPTNRKENIVFGICMCAIMVFFMGLLNISVHLGGFNLESIKTYFYSFSSNISDCIYFRDFYYRKIKSQVN